MHLDGDLNGHRVIKAEIVHLFMKVEHMDQIADFIALTRHCLKSRIDKT